MRSVTLFTPLSEYEVFFLGPQFPCYLALKDASVTGLHALRPLR